MYLMYLARASHPTTKTARSLCRLGTQRIWCAEKAADGQYYRWALCVVLGFLLLRNRRV